MNRSAFAAKLLTMVRAQRLAAAVQSPANVQLSITSR